MSSDGAKNDDAQKFEGIAMTGRMCYIFMCDWKPDSERMWSWTRYHWILYFKGFDVKKKNAKK